MSVVCIGVGTNVSDTSLCDATTLAVAGVHFSGRRVAGLLLRLAQPDGVDGGHFLYEQVDQMRLEMAAFLRL